MSNEVATLMSNASASTGTNVPRSAEREAEIVLDHLAADASGQWLVLIGRSGDDAEDESLNFLREMFPDVECDATIETRRDARTEVLLAPSPALPETETFAAHLRPGRRQVRRVRETISAAASFGDQRGATHECIRAQRRIRNPRAA